VKKFLRTPKGTLTAIFVVLLAVAGTATGWAVVAPHVLAAIVGACGVELLVGLFTQRKFAWPSSALLSGAIVAMILAPETPLVETLWVAGLATASKSLIATARGHVFNPAALALLVSIPLFATGQSWWGAGGDMPWPFMLLVLACGAFIVERINKFPLVLSFAGVWCPGGGDRACRPVDGRGSGVLADWCAGAERGAGGVANNWQPAARAAYPRAQCCG
jgi:H+/Na+-translocating ferredoxin:NAD+ oxidoreductase subunit D